MVLLLFLIFICHPSGWIQLESLCCALDGLNIFVTVVKPDTEDPLLLVVRSVDVMDLARKHSVSVMYRHHIACSH
jgi:hypothetical protein